MPDDSVRSHLEAIRELSEMARPEDFFDVLPHAVAALRLLDEADHACGFTMVPDDHPGPYPDSVCGASTENTPC